MTIPHLEADTTCEDILAAIESAGAVIVDRAVAPDFMDQVAAEMRPWMDKTPLGDDSFTGRRTRRTGGLVARSPHGRELVMNPLVLGAAKKYFSHARSYQMHVSQVIAVGVGEPAQIIHRDQWAWDMFPFPKDYPISLATMWAMTDFTAENGATRIVPGSHRFDDRLQLTAADTVPAEMRKGSLLMYAGTTYHGAGANQSDATRVGITIQYNVSWLRQEENQYLSLPIEIARTLPVDLLRLIGYQLGAYSLGYVDDLRDPIEIVRPDLAKQGLGTLSQLANAK
ncbi:MAG TPA: phytanoyl-CoA dioxygenase family protein [Candidatus Binataceae bacterium]|nr:phytanoyl-CoA dioxygenase family protein [Candidatus Binataceae bacterium]